MAFPKKHARGSPKSSKAETAYSPRSVHPGQRGAPRKAWQQKQEQQLKVAPRLQPGYNTLFVKNAPWDWGMVWDRNAWVQMPVLYVDSAVLYEA